MFLILILHNVKMYVFFKDDLFRKAVFSGLMIGFTTNVIKILKHDHVENKLKRIMPCVAPYAFGVLYFIFFDKNYFSMDPKDFLSKVFKMNKSGSLYRSALSGVYFIKYALPLSYLCLGYGLGKILLRLYYIKKIKQENDPFEVFDSINEYEEYLMYNRINTKIKNIKKKFFYTFMKEVVLLDDHTKLDIDENFDMQYIRDYLSSKNNNVEAPEKIKEFMGLLNAKDAFSLFLNVQRFKKKIPLNYNFRGNRYEMALSFVDLSIGNQLNKMQEKLKEKNPTLMEDFYNKFTKILENQQFK